MVGEVGPGANRHAAFNVSVKPEAFGAGVGTALKTMAQSLFELDASKENIKDAEAELAAKYKEREKKKNRSAAEIALIRANAQLDRDVVSMRDEAAVDGAGHTEAVTALARERQAAVLAQIDPDLQEEFAPRIEAMVQQSITQGFSTQIELENTYFEDSVKQLSSDLASQIAEGFVTAEEVMATVDELIDSSPLSKQDNERLRGEMLIFLETQQMMHDAKVEALHPEFGLGVVNNPEAYGIHAAGMPGVAVGFLNAIAGPESAGEYNRIFSQTGKEYFDDFSDHPRTSNPILTGPNAGKTSSAAGRYQFLGSTWDEAAAALGLTDFSPESQDRAAWWLAQRNYKQQSGGRDLQVDLASGDFGLISNVRRFLVGTWEGLGNITDKQFFEAVTSMKGTPSSIVTGGRYANVPYAEREAIMQDAIADAARRRSADAEMLKAETTRMINELKFAIDDGKAGRNDIEQLRNSGRLTFEQYDQLNSQFETKYQHQLGAEKFTALATSGQFNPANKEHLDAADSFFQEVGSKILAEGDVGAVQNILIPAVQESNYMPLQMAKQLEAATRSSDPATARLAYQTLDTLAALAPGGYAASVPKELQNDVALYSQLSGFLTEDEVSQAIRDSKDPTKQVPIAQAKAEISEYRKDNATKFDPVRIMRSEFDADEAPLDAGVVAAFESDYNAVYGEMYRRYRDHDVAAAATVKRLQQEWGTTSVGVAPGFFGGERKTVMKYPPEMFSKPFAGGFSYMQDQVRETYGFTGEQNFVLRSDAQTEREITQQARLRAIAAERPLTEKEQALLRPPSYVAFGIGSYGELNMAGIERQEDGTVRVKRVYFDPSALDMDIPANRQMQQFPDALKRAEDLAFQLGNDSLPPEERQRLATEAQSILDTFSEGGALDAGAFKQLRKLIGE